MMTVPAACALLLAALAAVYIFAKRATGAKSDRPDAGAAKHKPQKEASEGCCGQHEVCLKLLENRENLYFEDENLDAYAGIPPEAYNEVEEEEFRTVLYELQPAEVTEWLHALENRGIALPLALRDEALLLAEEVQPVAEKLS